LSGGGFFFALSQGVLKMLGLIAMLLISFITVIGGLAISAFLLPSHRSEGAAAGWRMLAGRELSAD
jgi:hypothetical protein